VQNRRSVLAALGMHVMHAGDGGTNLDFGDALIVASMQHAGAEALYSFDADFDRVSGITRREP
jgi:predicted nucleic acid-binding protein